MANNRMYLRCPYCPDTKPLMLAKYYPSTGWYGWAADTLSRLKGEAPTFEERVNKFFEQHRHDSQWGGGFVLEFEIKPDFKTSEQPDFIESATEPFPKIS